MLSVIPKITSESLPRHIAVIMDGNGRWAKAHHMPRLEGHRKGAESVRTAVSSCRDLGIPYLTLYAFSSENWKRTPREIGDLMDLLRLYLKKELKELNRNGVRLRFIGARDRLAPDIISLIEETEDKTAGNLELNLTIAVNYGGRSEITEAAKALAQDAQAGRIDVNDIDEAMFSQYLQTCGIPDPDLMIRTGGEERLSNFLLWQSAYAEFVFLDDYWPDFNRASLEAAICEYQTRSRRYGASDN